MDLWNRWSRYFLFLLLLTWTVAFFYYLGWKPGFAYNAQRYFEIFLLGCLLWAGVTMPVYFRLGRLWSGLCLALLLIMQLVLWHADNYWLAIREALQYLALYGAILVVSKARQLAGTSSFDRAAYRGVVLFCFGCSLIVLEGLLLSLSIERVDPRLVFGAFVNVRIFAELQFLTLFLLAAAWLQTTSVGWRRFVGVTAILWWGLLLLTGTRSALVALPFALLILWLVSGRETLGLLRVIAAQFAGGVLVFFLLRGGIAWYLSSPVLGGGSMSFARLSSSGRFELWAEAWGQFLQHPWLGSGPGTFACFTSRSVASPHNLFFLLISEWGILFTLLCFLIALIMFISLVRHLRCGSNNSPLEYSLFATLVVTVTASMMEGMILSPLQQMLIVLVFGWALHAFAEEKFCHLTGKILTGSRVAYAIIVMCASVITLWGVKADLILQKQLLVSPDGVINLSYGPRFWADGHDHCPAWRDRYGKF